MRLRRLLQWAATSATLALSGCPDDDTTADGTATEGDTTGDTGADDGVPTTTLPPPPTTATGDDTGDTTTDPTGTDDAGPVCGDGMADAGEDCDGDDLGGATCEAQGFDGGTLACAADCTFDTSACTGGRDCGNRQIDGAEDCDGTELGGADCESEGFASGTLACAADCTFDTSACEGEAAGDCCADNGTPGCDDQACQKIVCSENAACCDTAWDQTCADSAATLCPICDGGGAGDCCTANGSEGCEDDTCQQTVCAEMPECCTTDWTQACADAAADVCVICDGGGAGDCCAGNGSPGCEDDACQQIVCAESPDCCNVEWDDTCAAAAADSCAVCDGGMGGDCCAANGSPGCDDVTCQQVVCADDPFCCSDEWDQICADAAETDCVVCGGGGPGDCCEVNATAGCTDDACQQIVCADDPFCCSDEWDQLCVDAAETDCPVCGGGGPGDCCEVNATAGCTDDTCQQIVCADDPFCCSDAWDQLCVDAATTDCAVCGGGGAGDCCAANGTPGCEDATCEQIVCADDPFCCSDSWDQLCADAADDDCAVCGGGGGGNCCASNGTPGCDDDTCEQIVCANDPFCCTDSWDGICAAAAGDDCVVCGGGGTGDCCASNGTPGCEDVTCQQIICADDPFCCSDNWDQLCADAADTDCAVCGGGGAGNCCASNGSPGCNDGLCETIICAADPFCCTDTWDQICADSAGDDCGVCGGGGTGDCCAANGTPGCDTPACEAIVCAPDPFCCTDSWDQICANAANLDCAGC